MWSHGSGFKSHLHPSLASYMTSPCLSFYTSQHMTFSPSWAGGGEVRSRVCKALAGSLTLKAALWYVQCPHVSVGTWEGLTNWPLLDGLLVTQVTFSNWLSQSPGPTAALHPETRCLCPDLSLLHHSFHRYLWRPHLCLALCWGLRVNQKGSNLPPLVADKPGQTTTPTEAKL